MKLRRPRLHVQHSQSAFAEGNVRWTNLDLDPVPLHRRHWGPWSFIAYWVSDAFNAATWQFASSMLAVGLSWHDSLAIIAVSFFIISFVIAANGAVGAIYHVPFPVIARASWGFWGSYVAVLSRVILALFWFAIQNVNGGNAVRVMLGAIWPGFRALGNTIPDGEGITTAGMVGYVAFWAVQMPFLWLSPNQIRWLFGVKSVLVPVAWVAILVWAFVAEDGGALLKGEAKVSGERYSWVWLASMTSVLGNYATLSVNQSDFSRFSHSSPKWQLLYIPLLPLIFTFISFIGIAASSAGFARYSTPTIPWDPLDLISHWSSRSCRFFGAFSFALASLGVNISANSISAAHDLAALFPSYIDLRRGQILCALISWALVPWKILSSATSFLNFMSAYAVFLGPVAAIMCWDFWLVKRRRYDVPALYKYRTPGAVYGYGRWGVNWRAVLAFVVGVAPNLPGLMESVSNGNVGVSEAGQRPYRFGWLLGFVGASLVYVGVSWGWPCREALVEREVFAEEVDGFGVDGGDGEEGEGSVVVVEERRVGKEKEKGEV